MAKIFFASPEGIVIKEIVPDTKHDDHVWRIQPDGRQRLLSVTISPITDESITVGFSMSYPFIGKKGRLIFGGENYFIHDDNKEPQLTLFDGYKIVATKSPTTTR